MNTSLTIPGVRPLEATLDEADGTHVVVACPPHPQFGGDRHDSRLRAVSNELTGERIDCLRIDYGPWDEGRGEEKDVRRALSWATDRYDRVGLFGFSFGASMALLAGVPDGEEELELAALSALAPAAQVRERGDVVASLGKHECPVQVVYGERDDTADWKPIVEQARELNQQVDSLPADHFFVGQQRKVGGLVGGFLQTALKR